MIPVISIQHRTRITCCIEPCHERPLEVLRALIGPIFRDDRRRKLLGVTDKDHSSHSRECECDALVAFEALPGLVADYELRRELRQAKDILPCIVERVATTLQPLRTLLTLSS